MNPSIFFDLTKAQRDKTKLVQVQRMVTRHGKTFPQTFWVSPAEVKKTDKVLGGQQNLLPTKGSIPKPQKGVWDKRYFDSISQDKNDRSEAIAYLKECGVTWKEVSHPGINWMHALHARDIKFGLKQPSQTTPVNTPSQPINQQSQPNSQSIQPNKPQPNKVLSAMAKLDGKTLVELQNCSNGREMVIVLKKKLGQQGCIQFAKDCGVTWNEHSNVGINSMRMSMELAAAFDKEKGTVSYTGPRGKVGAPEGNQNAKKDGVTQQDQQDEPEVVEPEEIEITDSMTKREKTLATMINKINSEDDLKLFSKAGIVAEDDTAKQFIKSQLYKAYFSSDSNDRNYRQYTGYWSSSWGKDNVGELSSVFKGIPKKLLRKGLNELARNGLYFNSPTILYPRDSMSLYNAQNNPNSDESNYRGMGVSDLLYSLNVFSQKSKDGQASSGYEGYNIEKLQEQLKEFGTNSDGVVSILNHIKNKDPELATEADKMIDEYTTLLSLSHGSPAFLKEITRLSFADIEDVTKTQQLKSGLYTALRDKLLEVKNKYNMSDEDIVETLNNSYYDSKAPLKKKGKTRWDTKDITDSNNNVVYLKDMFDTDTWDKLNLYHDNSASKVVPVMISTGKSFYELKESDSSNYGFSSVIQNRDKNALIATVTENSYCTIQRQLLTFSGQKVQQYNSSQSKWEDVNTDSWSASDWDKFRNESRYSYRGWRLTAKDSNLARDAVLSNLKYAYDNYDLLSRISNNVSSDVTPSTANHRGEMPEANFNYFDSTHATGNPEVRLCSGDDSTKFTPQQANARIKEQIDKIPVMSKKQIDEFRAFVESKGSPTDDIQTKVANSSKYSVSSVMSLSGHKGTPVHDMIYQQLTSIADYCPQMRTARVNTKEKVDKIIADKMGYTPFNYVNDSSTGKTLKGSELKRLREEVLSKVHCSLKTSDDSERAKMESRVKHDWDKEKRGSDGKRLYGYISFKSNGVYQVNNAKAQEIFSENVEKIKSSNPKTINGTSYESNVVSMFHGTDFKGACGILGVDGYFRAPKNGEEARKNGQKYAGGMLGPGVYLADLAGKSAGYFGNWGSGYGKRGALLVCDAILGDHLTAQDSYSVRNRMDVDSVSMKSGTNTGRTVLRADEWCIRRNDFVCPKYIIDAEANRRNS